MVSRKDKRKSGYYTPNLVGSKKELIKNDLFVNEEYNDWVDWRDGFREWFRDFKMIKRVNDKQRSDKLFQVRIRMNRKQKKLVERRKARKQRLARIS